MYIANPCYEDWSKMTPVQHGRHCGQCSTVVLDMTRLSNDEILNLIKQTGGKCGRFYEDQLTPPAPPKGWLMQWLGGIQKDWAFASIVIMLQMNTPVEANVEMQNTEQINQERRLVPIDSGVALPGYIQGRTSFSNPNEPIVGKSIFLYSRSGKKIAETTTDDQGFFAFAIDTLTEKNYFIVFKTFKHKRYKYVYDWHRTKAQCKEGDWVELKIVFTKRKRIFKGHRLLRTGFY